MLCALGRKTTEDHAFNAARLCSDFSGNRADSDTRGEIGGKSVDPGRNGRISERCEFVCGGEIKSRLVAPCQKSLFVLAAATPYRSDGVDHVTRPEPIALCDLGGAGVATTQPAAFG